MNYADHVPPHFHVTYGDEEAQVEIGSGDIIGGSLPRRAAGLVKEWAELHRAELEDNWRRREESLLACLGNPDPVGMKVYCPTGKETFDDEKTEEAPPRRDRGEAA